MKDLNKSKRAKYYRRQIRSRAKMVGTAVKPRLSVFRSLRHIYAQAIDDIGQITLAAVADKELKIRGPKADQATAVGTAMAKKLQAKKISQIIFDRGAYKYHGRVKALAEAMRKAGIKF